MSLSGWYEEAVRPDGQDDVLTCIEHVARRFDRSASPVAVKAGLALDESGRFPFHQIEPALDRFGLSGERLHGGPARWRAADLPAIVRLANGRAAVLLDANDGQFEIQLPGRDASFWIDSAELQRFYDGAAIAVTADPTRERADERPWDRLKRTHWFWSEVWKVRRSFGFVALAAVLINLLGFALPLFTMNVYDRVIPNRAAASLWVLALGVLIAFLLEFSLRLARARLIDETGRDLDSRLSQKLFEKVMNIPLAAKQGSTGAFARRVSEYEMVREFFASTTVVLAIDVVFLFLFVALMAVLAGWLALVPVVAIAVMAFAGLTLQKAMATAAVEAQADSSLQHSVLIESIGGMETLKSCRAEGRMLGRWKRYADMSAATQERLRRLTAMGVNLAALCQQATSISLVIGGFYMFNAGSISMGAIIAIVMLAGRSLSPVGQLAYLMTRARQAMVTLDSLQTMMGFDDERDQGSRSVVPQIRDGVIALEHLEFSYPNSSTPSLSGLSITIRPGERIGVIGRVASGKSTFGRLLCGLYRPSGGHYLIDGLDSRQHHPHEIRSAFRYVGQDAELFSGTIRDNLALGSTLTNDDALVEALRKSGAGSFLARDAAGFDLHVGERGSRLSGGQRSFLVLARALVEPCRLLFLDEPTGAMDTQTERLFIEHLAKALTPDQTLVVSTHRNAMLAIIDRLIVIDQGRIVADGPRDTVLGTLAAAGEKQ
ncbi:type I secretion system permease/ATPase [Sphingomonas colocasiae]|uniref:Type I secretion system permease/ATPase n=1 Tax=Sphingomonas colocasiae TaxID=1848973 RepID=A0ABS7Q0G3_9SPHN|nr:type I secretion system permease/ATPase [Sphingomonas colocasiae]